MKSWERTWRELPEEERRKAAEVFWQELGAGTFPRRVAVEYLAARLKCRLQFVERGLREEKRVQLLAGAMDLPDPVIEAALRMLHFVRRAPMLRRFLDAAGLPHEDGALTQERCGPEPPTAASLKKGVSRVYSEFDSAEVRLYLDVLELEGGEFWRNLAEARTAAEGDRSGGLAAPGGGVRSGGGEHPGKEEPLPGRSPPVNPLRQLDHLVIDAVVSSVAGAEGCLDEEELDGLLEEVLALNPKRFPSYFHLGFADVLHGREPGFEGPEANSQRRTWYLCGAVAGLARRKDNARILRLLSDHPVDSRPLGSGEGPAGNASHLAAPILFEVLFNEKGPAAAAERIGAKAVAFAGPPLFGRLLTAASDLLRAMKAEEAGLLLDRLQDSVVIYEAMGTPPPPPVLRELRRRQAHRARLLGDHEKARALLESLLEDDPGDRLGMITADLGLIASGFRSLMEVRMPADPIDLPETRRALEAGRKWFDASAASAGEGGHGEFCLGVLHLAAGEPGKALPLLSRAVSQMERRPEVYDPVRALPRARLYQARCLAATLDQGCMAHAAEKLAQGGAVVGRESLYLVKQSLEDIASCDGESAARAAALLEEPLGDDLLGAARAADLLGRLASLRSALEKRAGNEARAPTERFEDYETLLGVGRRTGDLDLARRALDGLEVLAQAGGAVRGLLLERIRDESFYRPAWEPEDAALFRARTLEAEGNLEEAAAVLAALAHEILSRGGRDAAEEGRGLLERIRGLGVEPDGGLVRRMDATEPDSPPSSPPAGLSPPMKGHILFIGGNETQARYRGDILQWAGDRWPGVELTLEFPGWSSNWGRDLERYGHLVAKADALVLLKFVRTLHGYHLRRMCSEAEVPWFPCTGHGRDAICRAIEGAITTVLGGK